MAGKKRLDNTEILKLIQKAEGEPISKEHVMESIGISLPTLNKCIRELEIEDYVLNDREMQERERTKKIEEAILKKEYYTISQIAQETEISYSACKIIVNKLIEEEKVNPSKLEKKEERNSATAKQRERKEELYTVLQEGLKKDENFTITEQQLCWMFSEVDSTTVERYIAELKKQEDSIGNVILDDSVNEMQKGASTLQQQIVSAKEAKPKEDTRRLSNEVGVSMGVFRRYIQLENEQRKRKSNNLPVRFSHILSPARETKIRKEEYQEFWEYIEERLGQKKIRREDLPIIEKVVNIAGYPVKESCNMAKFYTMWREYTDAKRVLRTAQNAATDQEFEMIKKVMTVVEKRQQKYEEEVRIERATKMDKAKAPEEK